MTTKKRKLCASRLYIFPFLLLLTLCLLSACGNKSGQNNADNQNSATANSEQTDHPGYTAEGNLSEAGQTAEDTVQNNLPRSIPELGRIRQICELVSVECTYHNVAKSKKAPGIGVEHIGETERIFWIEYNGIAEISFDVNKIEMEQNDTEIIISLPRPSVSCKVDPNSWNENSYVISQDQAIQKNPITAEDQTKAIELAQAEMILQIRGNSSLLNTAKLQAQELIKNYIDQIGDLTGVQYHITWKNAESGS